MPGLLDVLTAPTARHEPGVLQKLGPHVEDQGSFRGGEKVTEDRRSGEDEPVRPRTGSALRIGFREAEIQFVPGATECQRRDDDLEAHRT